MAGNDEYTRRAKQIITSNRYMVIATSNGDRQPWQAVVFYVYTSDYTFYFLSATDSKHAKNIEKNPSASIIIFDSGQPLGQSEGLQAEGKITLVEKKNLENVINLYAARLFPKSEMAPTQRYPPEAYDEPSEFRFFKFTPSKMFLSGTAERRTEVHLTRE